MFWRTSLTSAESGFCQRVGHALRSVSSFSTAPAVTGVLCPGVPGGRLLVAGLCCAFYWLIAALNLAAGPAGFVRGL
jgi:hypothetical protein